MAEKSGGSNRNYENWKKSCIRKKAVWKRRKVEKFWGNARLVYRASFGGRSSLQFLLCLGFGLD